MQALNRTLFPCYAAADRAVAASLAAFLESGAGVRVMLDDGEIRQGEDLLQKAREARTADIVVVLFSRQSWPGPVPRAKWEPALQTEPAEENVRIAFLKVDDCSPPKVLSPQFHMGEFPLMAFRRLKRWLRTGAFVDPTVHYPDLAKELETLGVAIADRSGLASVDRGVLALEFTRVFREDFDDVIRLECGGRSLAALAGDLGSQLGLLLEGDLASNLERLRNFCDGRRLLLWLEGASVEEAARFGPLRECSTLISTEARPEAPVEEESLRGIQYTLNHPAMVDEWADLCQLARQGYRLARDAGRLAEGYELLEKWHALAKARLDRRVLDETAREMVWILEGWDHMDEARRLKYKRVTQYQDQMALPFLEME